MPRHGQKCCVVGLHPSLLFQRELAAVEIGIKTVCRHQAVVAALLNDSSVFHDKDDIRAGIVESLCATMKLVLSISLSKAFWIISSVRVSMEEVASSRISIGGRHSMTRLMQSSCFWPWL